jgi:hypothetical protein
VSNEVCSDEEAYARAAGRRRYNRGRGVKAAFRRTKVEELVFKYGWRRGVQQRIAQELEVSPSTISRDMRRLFRCSMECPTCTTIHPIEHWRDLELRRRVKFHFDPGDGPRDGVYRWRPVGAPTAASSTNS